MSTPSIPAIFVIVPLLLLVVGIVFLALGWRGRTIDNHPICRKCGFDLFGLDENVRCPECGNELSAKAIRVGHRAVRRWPLGIGVVFLLPALVILAAVAVLFVRKTDIETMKPIWWLIRDDDTPAVAELNRRLALGTLTPAQMNQIIEAGLKAQWKRDANHPWLPGWGDFIESARLLPKGASDEQWQRYAKGVTTYAMEARPQVRRGDPIPIRVGFTPPHIGSRSDLAVNLRVMRASIDGQPLGGLLDEQSGGGGVVNFLRAGQRQWAITDILECDPKTLETLQNGPHSIAGDLRIDVQRFSYASQPQTFDHVEWTIPLKATMTLVPADQSTVELVAGDPKLTAAVRGALVPRGPKPGLTALSLPMTPQGLELSVDGAFPPIDLALDVFLRDSSGREWPVTPIRFHANERMVYQTRAVPEGFDSDRVDVILRSNPGAAARTVDLTRIWSGELVYVNRAVVWQAGMPRPARFQDGVAPRNVATTQTIPVR
jgi:hypothetical protein